MPHTLLLYRSGFASSRDARVWHGIKKEIRRIGSTQLTTPEVVIKPEDFSFKRIPPDDEDELTSDLCVIILAHEFQDRVDRQDSICEELAEAIASFLRSLASWQPDFISVSVTLQLGQMGYHAKALLPRQQEDVDR